jgi:Zn-dependent protease with chaperone function
MVTLPWAARVTALALAVSTALAAQTRVVPPKNKYTPQQDVELGRQAAAEVRKEYPIITSASISRYLDELGRALVEAAPRELDQDVFEYSFTAVNLKEINAFALPGGPMFVNRGMIEAATGEGSIAGVMAHELSHVLLRHGTANATKAEKFQWGAIAGAITGAVVGGGWGEVISQGSQFGLGTWLLKYSREYEKQADLLGTQIMARAGYDPRELARMFEAIERQSRGGGPQWLSSHPNPGNRTAYIAAEAAKLQMANRTIEPGGFDRARSALATLPPAKSMAEVARRGPSGGTPEPTARIGGPVPAPSSQYRTARGGRLFQVSVPANWRSLSSTNAVKFVPENGYGDLGGQVVFTHGVEIGVARAASRDLGVATRVFIDALRAENPSLTSAGGQRVVQLSRRSALGTPLTNRSATGKTERIGVYTTFLADGNLFYYLTVVPEDEAGVYALAFQRVGESIRITDVS